MSMLYQEYPGIVEAKKLIKLCGFHSDSDACVWLGVHKFYIRDRLIIKTVGAKTGADVPNHLLVVLRLAFVVQCITRGNLLEITAPKLKKLDVESILKKAKKANISEKKLFDIGPINEKTNSWAIRYIELYSFKKHNTVVFHWFKGVGFNPYLKKIGMTIFEFSNLTKIPQSGLAKRDLIHPPYQERMAELIYRYLMTIGVKIDITKPYDIDLQKIMWKDKTEDLKEKLFYQLEINNDFQKRKNALKDGDKGLAGELEIRIENMKEKVALLDQKLKYEVDQLKDVFHSANMTHEEVEHHAKCERKRIIWRDRILPWSICFARLYNAYRRVGGERF